MRERHSPVVRSIPRVLPDAFDQHPDFTQKYYEIIKKYDQAISTAEKEHFMKMFKVNSGDICNPVEKVGASEILFGFTDDEAREWFLTLSDK